MERSNHKNIMILGTASSVGKSIITTGLCRVFIQDGYSVAPFKSQNMSLNSFITDDGLEMGRAQVVQAIASKIKPKAYMNPILLKPSGDSRSQVIINGKARESMAADDYFKFKPKLKSIIMENYNRIVENFDLSVIEGAGSCAEINLAENDIVNMGMAEMANAPCILVSDIERGGVFASIVGSLQLLPKNQRERIKGVIINKFRGDISLFNSGVEMLENIINLPVLGVVPFKKFYIEDEDGVSDIFKNSKESKKSDTTNIEIVVVKLPHISNFTDFEIFTIIPSVDLKFVTKAEEIKDPDIIIIPGSKNSIEDLIFLKTEGLDKKILEMERLGKIIFGICGGFQILGNSISDPKGVESTTKTIEGLKLLDIDTTMESSKRTLQVNIKINSNDPFFNNLNGNYLEGYEIHMGKSFGDDSKNMFTKTKSEVSSIKKRNIFGSYLHGIFDNLKFTEEVINLARSKRGLHHQKIDIPLKDFKEQEYNRLATHMRRFIDIDKIYKIMGVER
ncbi:MAG: cobyric acid synthase CobQ [Candidatus Cloacimonadota bacterium]|nr:MAG: cobyric acid synthase CobQ [Candidatus Cloacimonadota bacterium]PIE77879.1 MAG: cobyric acid synthase CobQ [Candidatus Delongbacteria bacterium]